jgi:hypothetical protein
MVTQRIANPYDQHTLRSKVPIKEFIILQSNLQAISWDTPGTLLGHLEIKYFSFISPLVSG